ncbi:MAG: T9SS type A sorting domain-containing protein [Muribaculaceae bacterium]|nr:T9SS type A sorting domain-containing protein [Muribaculaceae bacterium]
MKKITLFAAVACMALAAQAQYTCDPGMDYVKNKGPKSVDYIILADEAVAEFTAAGAKVQYVGPSAEEGRNLWYWAGFNPADDTFPRVDMHDGGYTSVEVQGTAGWSGAGFAINCPKSEVPGPGVNLSHFTDETMFHIAYFSPTANAPVSVGCILLDGGDFGSNPAKFALGDSFDDNGVIYPTIGPKAGDDWAGIEISLGSLKKIWPAFSLANANTWGGNIFAWLAGNVAGQTIAFDAMYFYSTEEAGINETGVEKNVGFVITDQTVNAMGANGIVLYNMAGQVVKSSNGTTLGLNGLTAGIYVAKAAGKTCKVIVK